MKFLQRILSKETLGADILRVAVCAILFAHGFYRLWDGKAAALGDILKEEGLPAGVALACLVCLVETAGTLLLAMRMFVLPITVILATIYSTGILLFHRHNGFFVVGAGEGGWEFSALLIICLLVTAWENRKNKPF